MANAQSSNAPAVPLESLQHRRRPGSWWITPIKILFPRKPLAAFGGVLMVVMVTAALLADVLSTYDPNEMHHSARLAAPNGFYLFGTDNFGRDIYSRILYGARTSLYVGVGVVMMGTAAAGILGMVSGYFGRRLDTFWQRIVDAVMAIPPLVLLLSVMSVLGPGLFNVILALSFSTAFRSSRVLRGAVIGIRDLQYVDGARAIGASNARILALYILPNILPQIIVIASIALGTAILTESTLSFLGYGVPPPDPTWGGMLSGDGRRYMIQAPWMAIFPGLALSLGVFGINVLGDGLRDVLDPRMRGAQ